MAVADRGGVPFILGIRFSDPWELCRGIGVRGGGRLVLGLVVRVDAPRLGGVFRAGDDLKN